MEPQRSMVWPIVGTFIIAAIIFGGGGYYLAKNYTASTNPTPAATQMAVAVTSSPSPTLTPTSSPTVVPSPSLVSIDATWNQYTNYRLGFSIKIPKTVSSWGSACSKDAVNDPIVMIEDSVNNTVYLTTKDITSVNGTKCQVVSNTLGRLKDTIFPEQSWKIVQKSVQSDNDLTALIRSMYEFGGGQYCALGDKKPASQAGVYDVTVTDTSGAISLGEPQCEYNNRTNVFKYFPAQHAAITWAVSSQSPAWGDASGHVYDQDIISSFKFLTQ